MCDRSHDERMNLIDWLWLGSNVALGFLVWVYSISDALPFFAVHWDFTALLLTLGPIGALVGLYRLSQPGSLGGWGERVKTSVWIWTIVITFSACGVAYQA